MAVIGAVFVVLGIWIMTRPAGVVEGGLVVVFFGSVLVIALARLHASQDELLPPWAVLLGSAGFTAACLVLLASLTRQPGPWSGGQVVVAVACAVGVAFFGGGGVAYAIITVKHRKGNQG